MNSGGDYPGESELHCNRGGESRSQQEARSHSLRALDPGYQEPGYWVRFRQSVLDRAAFELARRRELARESVATVLSGWSRSLIPVALAAAIIVAFLVGSEARQAGQDEYDEPLVLEEALQAGVGDGVFQAVMRGEQHASEVAFMAVVEGDR